MKKKLFLLLCALLTSVGMWADVQTDYTSSVNNDQAGWTGATGTYGNAKATDGTTLNIAEKYYGNDFVSGADVSIFKQTVSGLPNGTYMVVFYATANNARCPEANGGIQADASDLVYVYAGSDKAHKTYVNSHKADSYTYPGEYIVSGAVVTNGTLELGMYAEKTGTQWQTIQVKALLRTDAVSEDGVDMTAAIVNPNFESGDKTGWTDETSTNDKFFVQNNNNFSKKQGTYYAERYWYDNTSDINQTTPELPAGIYRITAAATDNAASPTFKLYAQAGSSDEVTQTVGAADDYSVEVSLKTAGTIKLGFKGTHTNTQWGAVDNFRLTYLGNPYPELKTAIETAEGYTLGFDAGEYAPYTNVDALTRLATAKSIYDAKTATYAEVVAAKEALESATWTANDVEKDAVYNGNMAVADGWNPKGWARQDNDWGQQVNSSDKDHDFSKTTNNTAWYYNQSKSSYYGETGYYTMPLKASTTYLLRVKYCSQGTEGGGLVTSLKATVKKGSTVVLNAQELGENSTRTFKEKSVTFTTTDAGNYVLELTNTGNFFFTDVSILKAATAADYTALNNAIAAHTPGFDEGEYAPYTNVDAMVALAAAKAIDQEATNLKSDVQDATDALTGATWTVNTELMDAIYDGQFASYTEDELNKSFKENGIKFPGGWLHDNSAVSTTDHIRQIATFSSFEGGRAMFFHTGTVSYGQTTGYTMPLRANAVYKFSFQYAGWSGYGTNPPSISILNENNEGMALTALPEGASAPGSGSTRYTVYFATDATPGNYIFKYQSPDNTNSTIGGLSLIRVDALPFSASGSTNYLPGTYSKVSVDRPMSSGTWNTLVIPVDMAIPGEWTVKEMDNFSESTLTFKNASSIVAGTPYLVKTTETIDNIIASDVEVKALSVVNNITKNGLTMKGVYANGYVPVSDGSATRYVVSGDYMYRVNSTVSIKPFRAYFELEGGNNAREIILNFNDDFTAINAIDVAENEFGAQKDGKYLIDGKIVIVKNGVKYGTNGQKLN